MAAADKTILVLGGGIAGVTAALDLAEYGCKVLLVEKEDRIGGNAGHLACMALDKCQKCNGCLAEPRLAKVLAHPGVEVLTGTRVKALAKNGQGYKVDLDGSGPGQTEAQAVILATGYEPYQAAGKPRYGYGMFPNVATVLELDVEMRQTGRISNRVSGETPKKVAFVQCVGSRDVQRNNYCSRICCGFALRMGRMLKHRFGTEVTVFYMDMQNFGHVYGPTLAAAREELRLVRAMPSDVFPGDNGEVIIQYYDETQGISAEEPFEMLILSIGLAPGKDNQALAGLAGLKLNDYGFFDPASRPQGLFLAGTVTKPLDVAETITQAQKAAQETICYLEEN